MLILIIAMLREKGNIPISVQSLSDQSTPICSIHFYFITIGLYNIQMREDFY